MLAALIAAADEAAAAIVALRGRAPARRKADRSPVTEADEEAERILIAHLVRLDASIPIVAEESAAAGRLPARPGRRFWLVDPLDGTREFLGEGGEFTVNVALIEDGRPTLSVVAAPAKGLLYAGDGARALRRRRGGTLEPVRARAVPAAGALALASRSHRDRATETFLEGERVASWQARASSLKFCLLAEGAADLYPRFTRTMEWDTAAGHGVLLAAGGRVTTLDGAALAYGKAGFENPAFVARGLDG